MPDTTQSTRNDAQARAAMDRLLAGRPLHTDGRLTVKNLAAEAGLSRQQVYRSPVLEEFNEHVRRVAERAEAPTEPHLQTIAKLRERLGAAEAKSSRYRGERDEARRAQNTLANEVRVLDELNQ